MIDPTRIFSLLVIAIMSARYLAATSYDYSSLFRGFYGHPYVLLSLLLYSLPYLLGATNKAKRQQQQVLSPSDQMAAEWYWWNAWLYHTVMDGLSGSFHRIPVVVQQYIILDKRFPTHHVVPWLIGVIELAVMAPLCFVTIHSILTHDKNGLRWPLELVTSTFQLFGMIVFVGAEVYEGQLNVPALDPVGSLEGGRWTNLKLFDLYHLTYYWFGFWFCNLVWGWVPLYRMGRALQECRKAFDSRAATTTMTTTGGGAAGANGSSNRSNGSRKAVKGH
jgi:hypothetical protein